MRIAELTTESLAGLLAGRTAIALLPVGSVEPHGPHLPLATDTLISEAVAARAAPRLTDERRVALIAPSIAYGVTNFAAGFAGAQSVPPEALIPFLRAVVSGYLDGGFRHVCVINNHLEPEHDEAVRRAIADLPSSSTSLACPLTRRWGRTLSAEYKSGACHAGRYETSLLLAAQPALVDQARAAALPALAVSLSEEIRSGRTSFRAMGLERAYTGAPAEATADEGEELLDRLATMVVTEVEEALSEEP